MDRELALGTMTFSLLGVVLGVAVQALIEQAGPKAGIVGQVGTFLVAMPIALVAARRVGRVTRISVLAASVAMAVAALWGIVLILNAVAEPAGDHVGWGSLFNAMNWRNSVFGTAAMLFVPQIWLSVLNRRAADNSFKPKSLRGLA